MLISCFLSCFSTIDTAESNLKAVVGGTKALYTSTLETVGAVQKGAVDTVSAVQRLPVTLEETKQSIETGIEETKQGIETGLAVRVADVTKTVDNT